MAPSTVAEFDELYEAIDAKLVENRELLHTVPPAKLQKIWEKIDRLLDRRARLQRLDERNLAAHSK